MSKKDIAFILHIMNNFGSSLIALAGLFHNSGKDQIIRLLGSCAIHWTAIAISSMISMYCSYCFLA